ANAGKVNFCLATSSPSRQRVTWAYARRKLRYACNSLRVGNRPAPVAVTITIITERNRLIAQSPYVVAHTHLEQWRPRGVVVAHQRSRTTGRRLPARSMGIAAHPQKGRCQLAVTSTQSTPTEEAVRKALSQVQDPEIHKPTTALGMGEDAALGHAGAGSGGGALPAAGR